MCPSKPQIHRSGDSGSSRLKISVALCTYNGEKFLPEQLESIAAQTRLPDELVITDDRSADRTLDVLHAFASHARFPVRISTNAERLGSTLNFESAIRRCQGEVIALCDQDDVWHPRKLAAFENTFAAGSEVGLIFSDAEVVDAELRPLNCRLWDCTFTAAERRAVDKGRAFEVLMQRNVVTGATMAFRANYRDLVLPVPSNTRLIHDGWIALVIASVAQILALPETLVQYRQHPDQQLGVAATSWSHNGVGNTSRTARAKYYCDEVTRLKQLIEWFESSSRTSGLTEMESHILELRDLMAHYQVRGSTYSPRFGRAPRILKELLKGSYRRYSNGASSAFMDFLR
jgi:glycosyltransferase involved in cell wall biosynthesis